MGKIKENDVNPLVESGSGEIVLYQPEGDVRLEVRMERESVWLSQVQMADLFQKDRTVIGRHIKNIYKEGELAKDITCANFAHMGVDADQTYKTILYNLDVIISVGYRVKSIAETRFDGFILISDLVKTAKCSLTFIDPYATIDILKFAAMRAKGVSATIYSAHITPEFKEAVALHYKQYPGLELKTMRTIHDRFLLVDDAVYHFGASFKDMGNEMTAFSVLNFVTPEEVVAKIQVSMK